MSVVKYEVNTEEMNIIHKVELEINFRSFSSVTQYPTTRDIYPTDKNPPSEPVDSLFKFKFQIVQCGTNVLKILPYFMSPTEEIVQCTVTTRPCVYRFLKTNYTVPVAKWVPMDSMPRQNNLCVVYFDIQFVVSNKVKAHTANISEILCNDYENLLKNGLFSDVIIKSRAGTEYKVHKAILATRCDVLKAHFEHKTIECHTNIVESPLESDVLREVLTFIYSGKVPNIDALPTKLLAAADYYQLSELKNLCEEVLYKRLTVDNAIDTAQLADLYSANRLKQQTLEFIKNGRAHLIIKTESWKHLESVQLMKTICEYAMDDNKTGK